MEELYRQNARIVYHFLYSMCHDETLSEELMQETFLKAFESIERYDGSCKLSTWLCQIARHLLYQYWEKNKRMQPLELCESLNNLLIAKDNPENQVINKIELEEVFDKLSQFPQSMQQVVTLRVMSDLPFKEIGAILGKSENWARVTFYRAKLILLKEVYNGEN